MVLNLQCIEIADAVFICVVVICHKLSIFYIYNSDCEGTNISSKTPRTTFSPKNMFSLEKSVVCCLKVMRGRQLENEKARQAWRARDHCYSYRLSFLVHVKCCGVAFGEFLEVSPQRMVIMFHVINSRWPTLSTDKGKTRKQGLANNTNITFHLH